MLLVSSESLTHAEAPAAIHISLDHRTEAHHNRPHRLSVTDQVTCSVASCLVLLAREVLHLHRKSRLSHRDFHHTFRDHRVSTRHRIHLSILLLVALVPVINQLLVLMVCLTRLPYPDEGGPIALVRMVTCFFLVVEHSSSGSDRLLYSQATHRKARLPQTPRALASLAALLLLAAARLARARLS